MEILTEWKKTDTIFLENPYTRLIVSKRDYYTI